MRCIKANGDDTGSEQPQGSKCEAEEVPRYAVMYRMAMTQAPRSVRA